MKRLRVIVQMLAWAIALTCRYDADRWILKEAKFEAGGWDDKTVARTFTIRWIVPK